MTIPMDNTSDLSSRERVQCLYDKTVKLEEKRRKAADARFPSDPIAWQQIRENYEVILLEDHSLSEKLEIEFALWQLHYRRIEELRALLSAALASSGLSSLQIGKGHTYSGHDRITKVRLQFKIFLSEASGFYHDLMVKIRSKYGLPLGYVSYDEESHIGSKDKNISAEMKKGLLCCHRCLIYLGDLSRYKGLYGEGESKTRDFAAASSYYMQASSMWPSSGNPHHQLAILATYSGDELVATYHYFRSLAVEHPFTTARDNLIIAFEKNRQSYCQLLGDTKASFNVGPLRNSGKGKGKGDRRTSKDHRMDAILLKKKATSITETIKAFNVCFVRLNGILFTRTSLETFGEVQSAARSDFLELLVSGQDEGLNFGLDATECRLAIIRLIAILIFSVHNASTETVDQAFAETLQRSAVLQHALTAVFDFMGLLIERCIQLTDPSTNCLLSGVMVFMEWLACRQDIAGGTELEVKQANGRSSFWSSFVSLLNKLLSYEFVDFTEDGDEICFSNMSQYDEDETSNRLALFEDFELRGFLPLLPAHQILDFSRKQLSESDGGRKGRKSRVLRIIAAGRVLLNVVEVGFQRIYFDKILKRFALAVEPQTIDEYSLPSSPVLNGSHKKHQVDSPASLGLLQSKSQLNVEGEEDDEVIVFKPTVSNKHFHVMPLKLTSSEVLDSGVNRYNVDLASDALSVEAASEGRSVFQNGVDTLSRPPSPPLSNNNFRKPTQPNDSKWLDEQDLFVENGLSYVAVLESGIPLKQELPERLRVLQPIVPIPLSVPSPHQYVNCTNDHKSSILARKTSVTTMFDEIVPPGDIFDNLSMKPSGLRKNPVSRPVRNSGTSRGFSSSPAKKKDEFPIPMDDYSWLDGYKFPSTVQGTGYIGPTVQSEEHHPLTEINNSTCVNFPFPGKQVSQLQLHAEKQKGCLGYQFFELPQLQHKGNQRSVTLPEQYQGQFLWGSSFFV